MEPRRIGFQVNALLEPREALARYFGAAAMKPPETEFVELAHARGRYLSEPIASDAAYPNAPRSAMDGFAVRSSDLPGRLSVAGEIAMGRPWPAALPAGSALRIPTGGVLPAGADTVVPVEDAKIEGGDVVLPGGAPGDAVTPAGSDMVKGERVMDRGHRLRPGDLALLATLGIVRVPVYKRPRIAVLSSGDELVPACERPGPGQIRDSNRYGVAAALEAMGALAHHLPTGRDDRGRLGELMRQGLAECDGLVLTGGSSVGEKDLTPGLVAALGSPGVVVHGLRVKPGKPTVLGAAGGKPIIGLPGNPASALAILEMVGRPIVESLTGGSSRALTFTATLGAPLRKRAGWTWYVPARIHEAANGTKAYPLELRSSSVSLLVRADGLLVLGEEIEVLSPGAQVSVRGLAQEFV